MIHQLYGQIIESLKDPLIRLAYVDLFCGAGGTSTGVNSTKVAKVIACVNHDKTAIASHATNHPDALHFIEDMRTLDLTPIINLIKLIREQFPHIKIVLWASLECTDFSKAKGGLPKKIGSRTLAEHLYRYLELKPDFIQIENVVEFMAWGPTDINGKPISRKNGIYWLRWRNRIKQYGYFDDWKQLNAANFGGFTSRNRLFGIFAKHGLSIAWPEPTHSKHPEKIGLFGIGLKKWMPVRDCLDLTNEGKSIFTRKKPLAEATLKRIYAGLLKFVAKGDESFVSKHSENVFIAKYYSNGGELSGLNDPAGTLTTKDRMSVVFIDQQYGNSLPSSIDAPAGTITVNPKFAAYFIDKSTDQKHHYLVNPQFTSKGGSIDQPSFTLIARMDKMPPYLVCTESGIGTILIYQSDPEILVKIKLLMVDYGITDIKMRMLIVNELKLIQGFPINYVLKGTKTEQKKHIGNAVEVNVAKAIVTSLAEIQFRRQLIA